MTTVGIRELRQRASELLRRVADGQTIEITDHGRPVALITPYPDGGPLERLRSNGEIEPAEGSLDDLPPPLRLAPGQRPPSRELADLRQYDR
jgi:prevent-host-death family protein